MTPTLSIYGLYEMTNGRVFNKLVLPPELDRDILIPEILERCSDFSMLYPDGDFMQMMIGVWSQKELPIWQALYDSTVLEYNPIENYDRHESITREVSSESSAEASSDTTTKAGTTSTLGKTSFDSYKFRDSQQETTDSDSTNGVESESSQESSGTETVTTHAHGNIGVTTAAQMIQGYRDISMFSVYDYIVHSFAERFCIQLY